MCVCERERQCVCELYVHVYVCDFALVFVLNELCLEGYMGVLSGVFNMRVIILHNVLLHST
jgi:hypothetical protein